MSKEKTIKDIIDNTESIHNGRWNWYREQQEETDKEKSKEARHYEGWFWNYETQSFERWEDLKFNG